MTATEVGDDAAALAARQRLGPLLDRVDDPFLRAVAHLAMAWTLTIVDDLDSSLREALASLEQLRDQDEPYWTAAALLVAGLLETSLGRHDDAMGHVREGRDLMEELDIAWLDAWSRVQLGTLAGIGGRLEDARALLDEGLELSLATHSTRTVTLCLVAFARLALAAGDAERPALLLGAADGLRRRAGLRAWPTRSASTRCSPPGRGSPSGRRWPWSATGAAPAPPPSELAHSDVENI